MALIDNLVSYWKLDEASGTLVDSHDNNDGTSNGSLTYGATGIINDCLDFDGTDDYVTFANEGDFDFENDNAFSLSIWLKPDTADTSIQVPISKTKDEAPFRGFQFVTNFRGVSDAGKVDFDIISDAGGGDFIRVRSTNDTNLNDGGWHHYIITYDGSGAASGVTIYEDGSALTLTTNVDNLSGTILNNDALSIGAKSDGAPNNQEIYNGLIDEVAVWSRELTSTEVTELHNSGSGLAYPFSSGTNFQINIGDAWKSVEAIKMNIGDVWKNVPSAKINIGDVWKDIF